ncbi:hypothetical protein ACUHMQ_12795 [Chitinimonas sp. PSY-7]|uniref:hypothetical protein n=1 Tax=Chitinimonas sp. PSY-7 TaxID=3459088 RepID=UPI00403FEE42
MSATSKVTQLGSKGVHFQERVRLRDKETGQRLCKIMNQQRQTEAVLQRMARIMAELERSETQLEHLVSGLVTTKDR